MAWPGLDARAFLRSEPVHERDRPKTREWVTGSMKLGLGVLVLLVVAPAITARRPMLFGWLAMIGLILILHFGSFHLLSCFWRSAEIDARPLMNRPLISVSVTEFWGRRWNTAFRDVTHRFLFRPLTPWVGAKWAIALGFLFSGIVHDLVISVPAGGGYGGPTLFFAIQALAIFAERSRIGRAIGLGFGWRGWVFTALTLILPAYGLFHPPFVRNVIVPMMAAFGVR
jgi:alginate O-acetyltransferase complex protein AlgI